MRTLLAALACLLLLTPAQAGQPAATGEQIQTIVFLRHGERPYGGMGQIMPQGLLRALALPDVLIRKFGRPDFLFAPSPLAKVKELDTGRHYYYLRPLATIEPTAIRCGLPVDVSIGYTQIGRLRRALSRPAYWDSTLFVAWEHVQIDKITRDILRQYGSDPAQVPTWGDHDYDTLYILTITRRDRRVTAIRFTRDREHLDGITPEQIRLRAK